MSNKIGWSHPVDQADQWDGFNESGIEHFAGSPIRHLAREVNQNALDASNGGTVRVLMQQLSVDTESIPNVDELRKTIALCKSASAKESTKAEQFFIGATAELAKKKISVLEISDSNTLGMRGPSTNGTPYYAFMKAKGQSKKESAVATGSFGIGKFAPYAVSKLRTVFVSTVYESNDRVYRQLTQGKSILMSHDAGRKRLQGAGFWGVTEKCQPVDSPTPPVPSWLARATDEADLEKHVGTKLSILGFDSTVGWKENLAVSVAENFFGSISAGKLEVDVDGDYLLDASTIGDFFNDASIRAAVAKHKNEPEQFDNCRHYLSVLQDNPEVITEESEVHNLGLCQMKLLLDEGLPKRVCFLRNGMFISDSLTLPGLKVFSDFKEFVAVVECKSKKGSELLRAMEPPRHDDFEPDRLPTREDQRRGEKALKELASWIRDMLKRHAKSPVSEVTTLDELKEYFADENGDGEGKGTEEVNPIGTIIIRAKPLPPKKTPKILTTASDTLTEGGNQDEPSDEHIPNQTNDPNPLPPQQIGTPGIPPRITGINNVRAIIVAPDTRRISFTPLADGEVVLGLMEAGADSDYDLGVVESDQGSIQSGKIRLSVHAKSRVSLQVKLSESFTGALKMVAYEI